MSPSLKKYVVWHFLKSKSDAVEEVLKIGCWNRIIKISRLKSKIKRLKVRIFYHTVLYSHSSRNTVSFSVSTKKNKRQTSVTWAISCDFWILLRTESSIRLSWVLQSIQERFHDKEDVGNVRDAARSVRQVAYPCNLTGAHGPTDASPDALLYLWYLATMLAVKGDSAEIRKNLTKKKEDSPLRSLLFLWSWNGIYSSNLLS